MDKVQIPNAILRKILLLLLRNFILFFLAWVAIILKNILTASILLLLPDLLTKHTLLPSEVPTHPPLPEDTLLPSEVPTHPPLPEEIPDLHTADTYKEYTRLNPAPKTPCFHTDECVMRTMHPNTAAAFKKLASADRVPCSAPSPAPAAMSADPVPCSAPSPAPAAMSTSQDEHEQGSMGVGVGNLNTSHEHVQGSMGVSVGNFNAEEHEVIELDDTAKSFPKNDEGKDELLEKKGRTRGRNRKRRTTTMIYLGFD